MSAPPLALGAAAIHLAGVGHVVDPNVDSTEIGVDPANDHHPCVTSGGREVVLGPTGLEETYRPVVDRHVDDQPINVQQRDRGTALFAASDQLN